MNTMKQQIEAKKAKIAAQLAAAANKAASQQTASASAEPQKGPSGRVLRKFLYEKAGSDQPRLIVGELVKRWSTEDGKHSFFKLIVVNSRTGEPSMFDINEANIRSVFPPLEA